MYVFSILRAKLTEIGICKNIPQYDVQMTSNYVSLLIKLSLNVGNDDYIILCNFDGLIISGLEAEEGDLRTSPRPFPVAGSKKLTGRNFSMRFGIAYRVSQVAQANYVRESKFWLVID